MNIVVLSVGGAGKPPYPQFRLLLKANYIDCDVEEPMALFSNRKPPYKAVEEKYLK